MIRKIVIFFFFLIIIVFFYFRFALNEKTKDLNFNEENTSNTNQLENIKYVAKDIDGNEYIINAEKGEIDLNNSDVIFLENVNSQIKLENSDVINITSDFGKYNAINYDTIFSKNVIIDYLENKITSEYLDFSLINNRLIVSRKIVFTNQENVLKADVIEIDLKTKDTKISMYEEDKKVNIKNKNYSRGNN